MMNARKINKHLEDGLKFRSIGRLLNHSDILAVHLKDKTKLHVSLILNLKFICVFVQPHNLDFKRTFHEENPVDTG